MLIPRWKVVEAARSLVGTPYHHQGRVYGPQGGVDCVGLIFGVADRIGLEGHDKPEFKKHSRLPPRGHSMLRHFREQMDPVEGDPLPGDVLIFWISRVSKRPQHIALMSDRGLIHTYAEVGQVVEHGYVSPWRERFVAAYKFRGVEPEWYPR